MIESFLGKCLVRRSKLSTTKEPVLIICGIFYPSCNIDNYSTKDEMWSARFSLDEVKKFESINSTGYRYSPEDFLQGVGHSIIHDWKEKQ